MDYVSLGRTGLKVSRLCLGCMTYGEPERGNHPWTLDEALSRPLIRAAIERGINFFDTANSYSDGTSEEFLGRALRDFARREEVVLATKVYFPSRPAPNIGGLSRKAIFAEVDNSLRRLQTDYIDLYQIHRWDYHTPIEETLRALDDVVRAGKVRYLGASSMYAWQFAKALYTAERHGWTRFATMQNHYNLIQREEEREMLPFCQDAGVAVLPWSPLARGRLARPWQATSRRQETDQVGKKLYGSHTADSDRRVIGAVQRVAESRGVAPASLALAWLLHQSEVTAPIIGVSRPGHLDDAIAALDVRLSEAERTELEEPYMPHPVAGHV